MSSNAGSRFAIQRTYLKSSECHLLRAPEMFSEDFRPEMNVSLDVAHTRLPKDEVSDSQYEVVLSVKLSLVNEKQDILRLSQSYAGVFIIEGIDEGKVERFTSIDCAYMLYPYVRECVDNALVRASLPPTLLPVVDFGRIFEERKKAKSAGSAPAPSVSLEEVERLKREVAMLKAQQELKESAADAKKKAAPKGGKA